MKKLIDISAVILMTASAAGLVWSCMDNRLDEAEAKQEQYASDYKKQALSTSDYDINRKSEAMLDDMVKNGREIFKLRDEQNESRNLGIGLCAGSLALFGLSAFVGRKEEEYHSRV